MEIIDVNAWQKTEDGVMYQGVAISYSTPDGQRGIVKMHDVDNNWIVDTDGKCTEDDKSFLYDVLIAWANTMRVVK